MKISPPHSFNLASFSPFPFLIYRPLSPSFNVFNGGSSILSYFNRLFQVSFFFTFLLYNHLYIQHRLSVLMISEFDLSPISAAFFDFSWFHLAFLFSISVAIRFCFWLPLPFCIALIFEVVRWIIKFELFVVFTLFEVVDVLGCSSNLRRHGFSADGGARTIEARDDWLDGWRNCWLCISDGHVSSRRD